MALSRKKKIIIAVSAVAVLALVIIISVFASRKEESEVTTVKIEVRPELRQTVTASGEVRPIRYIKLTSEVQGRIEEILDDEPAQNPAAEMRVAEFDGARRRRRVINRQVDVETQALSGIGYQEDRS